MCIPLSWSYHLTCPHSNRVLLEMLELLDLLDPADPRCKNPKEKGKLIIVQPSSRNAGDM